MGLPSFARYAGCPVVNLGTRLIECFRVSFCASIASEIEALRRRLSRLPKS
jgi:hypothetical protein